MTVLKNQLLRLVIVKNISKIEAIYSNCLANPCYNN